MLFDNLDVQYKEYKYERDFTKPQFYAEFGEGATFPQISINTKHIGGFKDTLHYFQENNRIWNKHENRQKRRVTRRKVIMGRIPNMMNISVAMSSR